MLDLTYREVDEFSKCMTKEVYDKLSFQAKIHGVRLKTPKQLKAPTRKNNGNKESLDKMAEQLLNRMRVDADKKASG